MKKKEQLSQDKCATATALEIVGDRWSLLIIRDAIFAGRYEYKDFLEIREGISTNILASRLLWLTDSGIFTKHPHPTNKKKYYYEITEKGFDLIPVIMSLAEWSWKHIPNAFSPPEIKKMYKKDPTSFLSEWKKRVKQRTLTYIKEANEKT